MQLVEKHIIKLNSPFYKEIDDLSFKTKNLYNSCLYLIRQAYINDKTNLVYDLHRLMKDSEQYKDLPAKVASTVLLMVRQNFKSFFKSLAEYKKNPSKFKGRPRLPKYLDPKNGRFIVSYTNQAISKKVFKKNNKISLSKTNIEFNTKIKDFNHINCVRLVPRLGYYVIEVVYTIADKEKKEDNSRYCAIDLGLDNLATMTSNIKEIKPIIFNGKPLKSINQFYNKKLAFYKSTLEKRNNKKSSKRIKKLNLKRNNKIDDFLHKTSRNIVNKLKENKINTLVIGKNDDWKQETNMGKKNNQNFVNIPHSRFVDMIKYKCEIEGINVIIQEESYTSKASFLNLDYIPKYKKDNEKEYEFSGYRKSRGVYKIKNSDVTINADVNGSYNILRKAVPKAFADGIEGMGVYPEVIKTTK
jgi:putative transposase